MKFQRVKDLRQDHDWTQQYIADLLYINRSTYSAYENGDNAIPIAILIKLSCIYGTSVDYLLGLTDETIPYPRKK